MDRPIFSQHRRKKRKLIFLLMTLLLVVVFVGTYFIYQNYAKEKSDSPIDTSLPESIGKETPKLKTQVLIENLDHPWAIDFLPDGTLIFTERDGTVSALVNGKTRKIKEIENVRSQGEGGLLGITVDSTFSQNNYLYLCYNFEKGNTSDIRVSRFDLNPKSWSLKSRKDIVTGIPSNSSGRHSGCRLAFSAKGELWITTGDGAYEKNPQSKTSLGGKVLRVDRDGKPIPGNLGGGFDSRIFNYGHRNVQGIFLFDEPAYGIYGVTTEHGPDEDDEINLLSKGNFGWDPKGGYNENVPMTDKKKFPNAIDAIWSSGDPTVAISNVAVLAGIGWGKHQGSLAVATLKAERLLMFPIDKNYKLGTPKEMLNDQGRIREVRISPDNALYITTDNGQDKDKIIMISPS